jgi:ABC-type transport system involved in multi-copper enzyme maturation permease subunit
MSFFSQSANSLLAAGPAAPSQFQWILTIAVGLLVLVALFVVCYTTRAGIIARATTKESIRQPVFLLMLAIALVILVINTFLPFFTLGDDVKMLKDCGMATILICSLLIAVWTSSTSIADEIEGKTAMTLLSKPINRRQFIVGKYLGIMNAVMLLVVPLSLCLLALIYYKVGYDAKESSKVDPTHAERMAVVIQIIPGLLLILLEVSVLSAVSVAISTRLPMVVNLVSCFSIFVVGHLTPVLVQSDIFEGRLEFVQFMAQAIATVLPALELFNISAAVATDTIVPPAYLGTAALYCAAYCTAAILLAFILFEDRDLA